MSYVIYSDFKSNFRLSNLKISILSVKWIKTQHYEGKLNCIAQSNCLRL